MSADNYLYVTTHPNGGYGLAMGFDSDEKAPVVNEQSEEFGTLEGAIKAAHEETSREYYEYGVRINPRLYPRSN